MANRTAAQSSGHTRLLRPSYLILGLTVLIAALVLLPQLDSFSSSLESIRQAKMAWVLLAAIFVFMTYAVAAGTLVNLALKKLTFSASLTVQVASGFAGKLAPAGIGGFAINARFLTRQRHSAVQAGAVMALNGALGFAGHFCIILSAYLFESNSFAQTNFWKSPLPVWLIGIIVSGVLVTAALLFKPRLKRLLESIKTVRSFYSKRPLKLLYGFLGASFVTLLFAGALYASARALGVNLSAFEVLLVYTAGAIGIALTPTPGGIGGAEAALTAGLVAVGVETGPALAVALLYRLVSYWLPILPGLISFQYCIRQKFI